MFTRPSVSQIESAYTGNAPALNARIKKEQQANNSISPDLRKLLALQDLTSDQRHMGIDQAMRGPMNPPTVAQNMQERAKQILQARMMQAQQKAMAKEGLAGMVPRNTPQPERQPEGLDQLPANVGESYAGGGIVAFNGTTNSQFVQDLAAIPQAFDDWKQRAREEDAVKAAQDRRMAQRKEEELEARRKTSLFNYLFGSPERAKEGSAKLAELSNAPLSTAVEKPAATPATPLADIRSQLNAADAGVRAQPGTPAPARASADTQQRVNVDKAPLPGGLKDLLPTPDSEALSMLKKDMRRNPEKEAADLRAKYLQEVGKKDMSVYDEMAKELKARKERLNAPKTGYDATMEYLEQIAQGGGRTWMEAGSRGAAGQKALQKQRQAEQDALMEKILDIGAKKSEAEFGERKGLFELTQAERKSVYDKAFDAAKAVNMSDDKAKELAQNAVLEREKLANQLKVANIGASASRSQITTIADRLLAADKTGKLTLPAALEQAARIIGTTSLAGQEVKSLSDYNKALDKLKETYPLYMRQGKTKAALDAQKEFDAEKARIDAQYGMGGGAGLNTLPTSGSKVKFLGFE